jgi:hypothetical protein
MEHTHERNPHHITNNQKKHQPAGFAYLACRVPDLQLDHFAIQLNSANFEVDTNCGNVGVRVRVIRKS